MIQVYYEAQEYCLTGLLSLLRLDTVKLHYIWHSRTDAAPWRNSRPSKPMSQISFQTFREKAEYFYINNRLSISNILFI